MTDIVLDLPLPPTVNSTRRIDWAKHRAYQAWQKHCDHLLLSRKFKATTGFGPYEVNIVVSSTRRDLDNSIKPILDYLVKIDLLGDDSPHFVRKITIQLGETEDGCRVTIRQFPLNPA